MIDSVRRIPIVVSMAFVGCVLVLSSCRNCGDAGDYLVLAAQIKAGADVAPAFRALGLEVPEGAQSPLDAKIWLARRAVACRCEDEFHAEAYLGSLLLERGELDSAIGHLERALRRSPNADGYRALSRAYKLIGDEQASATARDRAAELSGAWDAGGPDKMPDIR